jgi:molybdenum cofactor cytidylyltransferase
MTASSENLKRAGSSTRFTSDRFGTAMIAAVVLSAGESSRMGRPKALLPIDGETFIERIVSALKRARLGKIIVVTGHNAEEMRRQIDHLPVEILVNHEYKLGQLSSLHVAIRHVLADQDCDAILVHLVDHPYIDATLVNRMIESFYASGKLIVVPRYQGKRGHPVLLSRKLFSELLDAPIEHGAKAVVNAHGADTLEMDAADEGVTIDIDTPDEYRQYVKAK